MSSSFKSLKSKSNMGSMCLEILKWSFLTISCLFYSNVLAFLNIQERWKTDFVLQYNTYYKILKVKTVNFLTIIIIFAKKSDNQLIHDLTYIFFFKEVHLYCLERKQHSAGELQSSKWRGQKTRYWKKNINLKMFSFLHNVHLGLGSTPRDSQLGSE